VPEDLARQVFGIWSDVCLKVVRQRGWHDPQRYSPRTSRGVVFARETPEARLQVVSALGLPDWRVGEAVTSPGVLRAARALQEPKRAASPADPGQLPRAVPGCVVISPARGSVPAEQG